MIKMYWARYSYLFLHWLFSWNQDEDGDITFTVCQVLHFTKYKEHTRVTLFNNARFKPAEKYLK